MGPAWAEIDEGLRGGAQVVAASERAARSVVNSYHRARQAEGLSAWPAPNVQDWKSFTESAWRDLGNDPRLLLNSLQEQSLWEQILSGDRTQATILEGSRQRLAALAMEAHTLLCSYAPSFLRTAARAGWYSDAAVFSVWLAAFDDACRAGNLISPARLPLDLISRLEQSGSTHASSDRSPLLLVGFDRILPVQRTLFDAWGPWQQAATAQPAAQVDYLEAADVPQELAACARWCSRQLAANPDARLLVIAQQASTLRGQIERAFLNHAAPAPPVEFSLGVPLSQVDLARGALLLLRWLTQPIAEHELDWLFSTGQTAATPQETLALQQFMRAVRARGDQRPEWPLQALLHHPLAAANLPAPWLARINAAFQHLTQFTRHPQRPLDWAELLPQILDRAGWPGSRSLQSAEFQTIQRWQHTVESCGSLGFDGRRILWLAFVSALARALDATLFDLESRNAPILVAGPAESAGLTADAIWFLGADQQSWPAAGSAHPLIPLPVQRDSAMPHATPQFDWSLARSITTRLLASAPEVHFSYARQKDTEDTRPSRLIEQFAGAAVPLPPESAAHTVHTEIVPDTSQIPFAQIKVEGGSAVLTAQSQCPFRAFATARLGAKKWDAAEPGLTASQRGQLLHATLRAVWSGPPAGLRSLADLQQLPDKRAFVAAHVDRIFHDPSFARLSQRMPSRYLALEQERLTSVVTDWLDYESTRADFTVAETEAARIIHLEGLTLEVRLDRIDRLSDDSLLVIDYKSGNVSPSSWKTPRPEDVQLPLYAEFAFDPDAGELGGLTFAKVLAGEPEFAGFVRDARATLLPALGRTTSLVKKPLSDEQLEAWYIEITKLARDFLAGNAQADPRDYPKTCERCGLQSICRIDEPENQAQLAPSDDSEEEDAPDA
jgi:probable DNA repair protein